MSLDFYEVEAAFADPFLLKMDYWPVIRGKLVCRMDEGEFDHFEPLWKFLQAEGTKDLHPFKDFLILPAQIAAASQIMPSLWPEIHRTRQFFHVDDDPFWAMRDLLERIAANDGALLALW